MHLFYRNRTILFFSCTDFNHLYLLQNFYTLSFWVDSGGDMLGIHPWPCECWENTLLLNYIFISDFTKMFIYFTMETGKLYKSSISPGELTVKHLLAQHHWKLLSVCREWSFKEGSMVWFLIVKVVIPVLHRGNLHRLLPLTFKNVNHLARCNTRRPGGTANWVIRLPNNSLHTNTAQMVGTWLPALIVCWWCMVIKTQNNFELYYQDMDMKWIVSHDNLNDTGTFCYCNQVPSLARPKSQLPHIAHVLLLGCQDQNTENEQWKRKMHEHFADIQSSKPSTWVTAGTNTCNY